MIISKKQNIENCFVTVPGAVQEASKRGILPRAQEFYKTIDFNLKSN